LQFGEKCSFMQNIQSSGNETHCVSQMVFGQMTWHCKFSKRLVLDHKTRPFQPCPWIASSWK
jgi:hypothetical protein